MNKEKFCKDCINFDYTIPHMFPRCVLFDDFDLVTGTKYNLSCYIARDFDKYCGKEGKFFDSKLNYKENNKYWDSDGPESQEEGDK